MNYTYSVNFDIIPFKTSIILKIKMKKRVIVDIDAGTDDAFALILLLNEDIDILAINCVNGNTSLENVYKNVKRILRLCNREDIPVYLGANEPLITSEEGPKHYFHGKDGFGDLELDNNEITVKNDNLHHNAIFMLHKIVMENPNEISLICLGPLTNIALAMKVHSNISKKFKEIFIMGGNHKGVGNVTSAAEFNFHTDPESAYIVLHYAKCPITILPWEPCMDSTITFDWRYNVLGNLNHPTMDLLNAAEKSIYAEDEKYWLPCDAFLVACFLYSDIAKQSFKCSASVELRGHKTRAQMVIGHVEDTEPNVLIITELNIELFKSLLLKTFNQ